jgi:hypothetical protein
MFGHRAGFVHMRGDAACLRARLSSVSSRFRFAKQLCVAQP